MQIKTIDDLPEWGELCAQKADLHSAEFNPIEQFIFDQEPADKQQCEEFRQGLFNALRFVIKD